MDLNLAIRTAYFGALNGNVVYNSKVVSVYNSFAIPDAVEYPYIILSDISSRQISVKRRFLYNANAKIDIVTGSLSNIGCEQSEIISEIVQNILIPLNFEDLDLSANGFSIAKSELQNNFNITDRNAAYYIFRKILNINHLINKL